MIWQNLHIYILNFKIIQKSIKNVVKSNATIIIKINLTFSIRLFKKYFIYEFLKISIL